MKKFMEYNFNIEKITLACHVPRNGGAPIHKNRPSHGLAFHTNGERYYIFDDNKILAKANDIIYLPKNSDYIVQSTEPGECYAINFDVSEQISFNPFLLKIKNSNNFLDSFKHAERVWRTKKSGFELKCKSELYDIIYNLRKEYELGYVSKTISDIIKPAIDFIHREYTNDNLSIKYLSELCGISEAYFRRIFLRTYGITPLKYINNLKISRAKELIASGIYSIKEVTYLSGFHDECYFSREFKKSVGISPSEYY